MPDLTAYYQIVEEGIDQLGVNAQEARGENDGEWNLKRGTASVWIDLWYIEEEQGAYFQVMSPIMTLPEDETNMYKLTLELLKINYTLFGVGFAVQEDGVYLKNIREVEELDPSEVVYMIGRCGNYGDSYNDELVKKFGGRRIE
jgi:hypothetical protein